MGTDINIKKKIAVQEESVTITSDVNSINFIGAGVTATPSGDDVTVNIPGSIGATVYYMNDTVYEAPYEQFSSIATSAPQQTIPGIGVPVGIPFNIAAYQTPVGVPNTTVIPVGLWQFFVHFGGTPGDSWDIYVNVYKRDTFSVETLLLTTDTISTTTLSATPTMILTDGIFPTSSVLTTDRIVVKVYVVNTGVGPQSIDFFTEGSTYYSVATTTLNQTVPTGAVTSVTGTAPVVSSGGTTPAISMAQANGSTDGYLDSADWATFNSKQDPITLTTTGTSGAATLIANTLNIPQYQAALLLTTVGTSGPATLIGNTLNIPSYSFTDTNIYNTDGTLTGNRIVTMSGNTLNFSGGNVGINQPTPTVPLHIKSTAVPSTNENIVRLEVSDAPTAYLAFNNASTVNGEFVPEVVGRQGASSTQSAIYQGGYIDATQDAGTTPVTIFRSALASLTQVVTRPLFAFRNWSTTVMTILADGKVGIGTTTPTEKLEVSGKTKTTTFQMTTAPTAGYVLTSDASGNGTWSAASNIYNANGSLTGARTLDLSGNTLSFLSGFASSSFNINIDDSISSSNFIQNINQISFDVQGGGTGKSLIITSSGINVAGYYNLPASTVPSLNQIMYASGVGVLDFTSVKTINGNSILGSGNISITGGLTYFTEAQNTAAPNATVPVDSLTAVSAATDADVAIVPKGTGALIAAVPNNLTSGGNKRGQYAVDWQMLRNANTRIASGNRSVIIGGYNNGATNTYSIVGGESNQSLGYASVVFGANNTANDTTGVALGNGNNVSGQSSVALGESNTITSGRNYAFAAGGLNTISTTGGYQTALGYFNTVSNNVAVGIGYQNTASGSAAVALGQQNTASGTNSTAIGYSNIANTTYASAVGYSNTASGIGGSAVGWSNIASGVASTALGYANISSGQGSISAGYQHATSGNYGYAFGQSHTINNDYSGAFGIKGNNNLVQGRHIVSNSLNVNGDCQKSTFLLYARTTNGVAKDMTFQGLAQSIVSAVILVDQSAYRFKGTIIGKKSGTTDTAAWDVDGLIVRGANAAATTLIVGNVNLISNIPAWGTPTLAADTTNGGLRVQVTGAAATNIQWTALIESTEVIYA